MRWMLTEEVIGEEQPGPLPIHVEYALEQKHFLLQLTRTLELESRGYQTWTPACRKKYTMREYLCPRGYQTWTPVSPTGSAASGFGATGFAITHVRIPGAAYLFLRIE